MEREAKAAGLSDVFAVHGLLDWDLLYMKI